VKARKRFGQHFLEPVWIAKLVAAINPAPADRFIEIGPGHGALTEPLAARVDRLAAIEIDRDLAADLRARAIPNVLVICADVLDMDLGEIARNKLAATAATRVRVVGNLPYNITSPILFRLLDAATATNLFADATLMLQKEVADRLVAVPGTGDYGVLTLTTALAADVTRLLDLPPGAFRPMPRVRSAVVRVSFRPPNVPVRDTKLLVEMIRSVFQQRRKTLANALSPFAVSRGADPRAMLSAASIDPSRRPETLQLIELARLADVFQPG
jgi:16S rRNA (adenine1518-N6/adenine1519-N6)-dimethyltransferase